jgi:hypothetical protein
LGTTVLIKPRLGISCPNERLLHTATSTERNGLDSSSLKRHRCAKLEALSTSEQKEGVHTMQNSNVIGIDLAKHVIQVCKIDKHGELTSNKAMSPSKLKALLANSIPSIIGMAP